MKLFGTQQRLIAFLTGILTAVFIWQVISLQKESGHPIGYIENEEDVHVHSDFLLYIDGTIYDLTDDKYQSKAGHVLHEHIHLHDNNDEVIHRHDHGITLENFFNSLGFELSDSCIVTDTEAEYCSTDSKELRVFVNGDLIENHTEYINQERDQILVYYGDPYSTDVTTLISQITSDACIYSGTCPERGTPPPESCGITCEI